MSLLSGNIQCQHVEEVFHRLKSNVKLYLFSAVRGVDTNDLYALPRLEVEAHASGEIS